MRLSNEQFKRFRALAAKIKAKKATPEEQKEYADLEAMKSKPESNDLSWWNNYPELLKDVVNFPFNWIPGTPVPITGAFNATSELNLGLIAIAKLQQAIGRSISDADAFNTQIRQLWIDMHRKYRGIGSYEKSDLGIAILAIHNVFMILAKFERIYGVINTYHVGNRVVPNGLKDALGIGPSLEENLADFRYTLNLYIEKCRQLCLPKGLSMLTADIVSLSNLFKDSKDRRAFIFGYDSDTFGFYDATLVNTGGTVLGSAVRYEPFDVNYMNDSTPSGMNAFTLSDVQNILEKVVTALLSDDDINIMCSDLIAAYGPENVMTLVPVPEDYKVEPVEDYERSLQFHNLTIAGPVSSIYEDSVVDNTLANNLRSNGTRVMVYQHDNVIKCRLGKGTGAYALVSSDNHPTYVSTSNEEYPKFGEILFDTWVEQPGETEVMCGTRYCCIGGGQSIVSTNTVREEIFAFGGMVVTAVELYVFRSTQRDYSMCQFTGTCVEASKFQSWYGWYAALLQLDWAPIFFIVDQTDTNLFGDIDNFTRISEVNLERLHEVALLSGYKIPMVSRD